MGEEIHQAEPGLSSPVGIYHIVNEAGTGCGPILGADPIHTCISTLFFLVHRAKRGNPLNTISDTDLDTSPETESV